MTTTDDKERKRAIVVRCLREGVTPDRAIAERAGCSLSLVRYVKAELAGQPYIDKRRAKR